MTHNPEKIFSFFSIFILILSILAGLTCISFVSTYDNTWFLLYGAIFLFTGLLASTILGALSVFISCFKKLTLHSEETVTQLKSISEKMK